MNIVLSPFKQVVPGWVQPVDEKTFKLLDYDKGELNELVVETILERFPLEELSKAITHYGEKVRKGGLLKLIGPDLRRFCEAFSRYDASHADFKQFVGFQCALSVDVILDNIPRGFKLRSWDYSGSNYVVEIERL